MVGERRLMDGSGVLGHLRGPPPHVRGSPQSPHYEEPHTHTLLGEKNIDRQRWMELMDFTIKTNEADRPRSLQHT